MTPNTIQFHSDSHTEVLRLSKDGIWVNPDIPADEAAKLVLAAMECNIKVLVDKAVADERKAIIAIASDLYYWDHTEKLIEAIRNRSNT
jgi:hypothetical protein